MWQMSYKISVICFHFYHWHVIRLCYNWLCQWEIDTGTSLPVLKAQRRLSWLPLSLLNPPSLPSSMSSLLKCSPNGNGSTIILKRLKLSKLSNGGKGKWESTTNQITNTGSKEHGRNTPISIKRFMEYVPDGSLIPADGITDLWSDSMPERAFFI